MLLQKLKGILKNLKGFKFIQMTHFLLDLLIIAKKASCIFQKEDIFISSVQVFVKKTVKELLLSSLPGHYEDIH